MGKNNESVSTMLASEKVLKKEWDNEEDERWNEVHPQNFIENELIFYKNSPKPVWDFSFFVVDNVSNLEITFCSVNSCLSTNNLIRSS